MSAKELKRIEKAKKTVERIKAMSRKKKIETMMDDSLKLSILVASFNDEVFEMMLDDETLRLIIEQSYKMLEISLANMADMIENEPTNASALGITNLMALGAI